jgi:hypothetical protein
VGSYNPDHVLSTKGLNTVLFTDPYAKLCYTSMLAARGNVAYIDLDTTFSAYFNAGLIRTGRIDAYLPSEGSFMPMFKEVLAAMPGRSLVIFDSINSFYTMYYYRSRYKNDERAGGSLNHLLTVLLMLLVRQGSSSGVPVVATSMLRFRRQGGWKQSPASRRLLQQKSATKVSVDLVGDQVVARVMAHESIPEGTVLSYPIALG